MGDTVMPKTGPRAKWSLVVLLSPFGFNEYGAACVRDSLGRQESPISAPLLLFQPRTLDDRDPDQRADGLAAGHAWIAVADAVVVYNDHGITPEMRAGIDVAQANSKRIWYRKLHGHSG